MIIRKKLKIYMVCTIVLSLLINIFIPFSVEGKMKLDITQISVASPHSLCIKWDGITDTREYRIYRTTKKNGKFRLWKRMNKNSCINKGLTQGVTYYYKVEAVLSNDQIISSHILGKTIPVRPEKPKISVKVVRSKNEKSYSMHLYMKKVTGAKYVEARWKPTKGSGYFKIKFPHKISHSNPVLALNMGKYKTIYIQIRSYNKKGVYSRYSNLVKVKRSDYKKNSDSKTVGQKPSVTNKPALPISTASTVPQMSADITPCPTSVSPPPPDTEQGEDFTISAYAETSTVFAYQTVRINATVSTEVLSVSVSSKTQNNSYGPFYMTKNESLTWYFDAEFFEVGQHTIKVTAYSASGKMASVTFPLTVKSPFG